MDRNKGIWGIIACIFIVGLAVTFTTSKYITHQEETGQMETAAAMASETAGAFEAAAVPSPAAAQGGTSSDQASAVKADSASGHSGAVSADGAAQPGPGAAGTQSQAGIAADGVTGAAMPEAAAEESASTVLVEISPLEGPSATKAAGGQTDLKEYYLTRLDDLDAQIQKMRSEETDSTTYSMKSAAENELKLWDNELNTIYSVILKQMNEDESKKLVEEERAWMKERDSLATDAAQKYSGGTIEELEYTASLAESTKARAYELVETYFHN